MAALERQLAADKALRDASKLAFDTHLAQVKQDLAARGVGERIADEVVNRGKIVFDEAVDVVHEHPGAVGGTIAALVLWLLRNPLIAWSEKLLRPR